MLNILSLKDSINLTKENGTAVNYYLFDEYEIHINNIPPNTTQEWHKHSVIEEVILVTKGELVLSWLENGIKRYKKIYENQLVQVKQSIHTFSNKGNFNTTFIVFRLVLDGKDKRDIIKVDKEIIEVL